MTLYFCWNRQCNNVEVRWHDRCPQCGSPLHTEAATERAAIREFDGGLRREMAEKITEEEGVL